MREILLIDGNSMLFRAYYGTLNRGKMASSSGVVTNAVYGFSVMLNRAIDLLKPTHVLVAFDTGQKTFRHKRFDMYKGTRKEVDEDLVSQFALVREFLDALPILRYEMDGYEADDIIGTLAKRYTEDHVTILTSDKDLLQIVDNHVDVLLMKKGLTELEKMTPETLHETMGLRPSQIIDLKAMMGDASDNIPGIPSVGEKTALKLLKEYDTLDGVYQNQDLLRGKLGEKVREYKEQAYLSYDLATIYCEVPVEIEEHDFVFETDSLSTNSFYRKYDMNSLVKETVVVDQQQLNFDHVDIQSILQNKRVSVVVDTDDNDTVIGASLSDGVGAVYVNQDNLQPLLEALVSNQRQFIFVNAKAMYRYMLEQKLPIHQSMFDDVLLLAFIVDGSITTFDKLKDSYNMWNENLDSQSQKLNDANKIHEVYDNLYRRADVMNVYSVYETIEKPLISVLAKCEFNGFTVDQRILDTIATQTEVILNDLSEKIFAHAHKEFNINSPKQLATVLFDDLGLKSGKKRSTAVDVLEKLASEHEIVQLILVYRKYQKLYSTYAVGLVKHIRDDQKIHTTLNQHLTQTGRLSSSNPNLQNISVRDEEGKMIRGAFVASKDCTLLKIDYSQIELRVLAFLANETKMIEVFKQGRDIHEETAREIFNVDTPTSLQRREAKSVNFGIVYGMSEYGLSQQLDISFEDARDYLAKHQQIYPRIHEYMAETIQYCEEHGFVETFFKRRRYISEIKDKNYASREFGKRAAMNAPVQGTAADIIKMAMIKVDTLLDSYKSRLILQVHDELIFDVENDELDALMPQLIEIMETIVSWPVALKVSASTGKTWKE
ncbi:DNA polymerase [Erysipelothrix larvae]|uniref:DNA-directed DNA polymerase n=1 Tax=Erysipelothrix larvae TaxID=1514105 RepID=A0A120JTN1_9FIRM|nr:DNA polymerase I [Erysipelothrix larvae]AMC93422.1 DNA polymerase [Erysipelothrix larvae]